MAKEPPAFICQVLRGLDNSHDSDVGVLGHELLEGHRNLWIAHHQELKVIKQYEEGRRCVVLCQGGGARRGRGRCCRGRGGRGIGVP